MTWMVGEQYQNNEYNVAGGEIYNVSMVTLPDQLGLETLIIQTTRKKP